MNQTSEWNGGQFPAGNAIDGNSSTFSHTDTTTPNNRWEVLLDQEYEVARIEVEMRGDCCAGRMTGTIVRGFDGTESSVFSAELSDPGIGGTVIFEVPMGVKMERVRVGFEDGGTNPRASTTMIHLGEVRVFAQEEALVAIESFAASPGEVSAGQEVSLNWTTIGADEVRLFPGGQLLAGTGSIVVNPSESVVYEIEASNSRGSARSVLGVLVDGAALPFQVTEVVASNGGSLVRSDGSTPDWIELWNPNPFELDLSGYGLSDDESEVKKFVFPSKVVPAGGYLVVDAADQSVDEVLATGFNLGRDAGEILILSGPDLQVLETLVFPKQYVDLSYGSFRVEEFRYFVEPSPGEAHVGETVRG